ncbi:MAG TPA: hypothetical protein VH857_01040 [Actinomycetes bacterium]|nr:hypothetical protein [Actinomycetes bacterium]
MTAAVVIIVLVVLALVAIGLIYYAKRTRETAQLQERFGSEYERAVGEQGSRRSGEHHLADVANTRDKAEIRTLTPAERERYTERWTEVQADFVDDPAGAAHDADVLVGEVMRDRGYPLDDVEDRADLVATDHAELAGHYRAAHEVGRRAQDATTEELRQALVHYRALFVELLGEATGAHAEAAVTRPADAAAMDSRDSAATGSREMTATGSRDMTATGSRDLAATDGRDMAATDRRDTATTGTDGQLDGQQRLDLTDSERTRQSPPA